MMKSNILAVIFTVVLLVGTTNATEIYNKGGSKLDLCGKIVGLRQFSDNNADNRDKTYAHISLKGETQINNQLTGYSKWEYSFLDTDYTGNFNSYHIGNDDGKTRLAYVGIRAGDYASFDYGRNYGVIHDALEYTDILPVFSGDNAYSNNFFAGRTSSMATYRNTNLFGLVDGLHFSIQHLGKNGRNNNDLLPGKGHNAENLNINRSNGNGNGWGSSLSYEFNDVAVVAAYGATKLSNLQRCSNTFSNANKAEQWVLGLKYDANNVYLAANYGETHNATPVGESFANKTNDVILVAQYKSNFGLRPSIAFNQSRAKYLEGIGNLVKYVEIGATYYLNKNISTYVDYKLNCLDKDNKFGMNSDDTAALGITYRF